VNTRIDVYETADGPRNLPCTCDGRTPCLWHWYHEVKMYGAPKPIPAEQTQENLKDRFPGRKPERRGPGKVQKNPEAVPARGRPKSRKA
jgi:hypothetical protein